MSKSLLSAADDFPKELQIKLTALHRSLSSVEEALQPLMHKSREDFIRNMAPLDCAKADLVTLYAINSLFWVYLQLEGCDPREHGIKGELSRIQQAMQRLKETTDKANMPRLDQQAAKRFIRGGLWEPKDKDAQEESKQGKKRKSSDDRGHSFTKKSHPALDSS
ncbi:unnamed protein product [Darwinula stevensoni]|uniref:Nuclear nucleic acid-binding protein C1D n=1 Tax=Darwinula stevensoni TaxID=69355 RepID=A0A7R9A435_9CRUS|nr:unnamed protein product [Darwinula stevensoni]CAG0891772.1 unnamed protein product [Darwinula stevensoni]